MDVLMSEIEALSPFMYVILISFISLCLTPLFWLPLRLSVCLLYLANAG